MPRYIARAKAFKKKLIAAKEEPERSAAGVFMRVTEPPVIAFFSRVGVTPQELRLAQEQFGFKDGNPAEHVSVFDTDEQAHEQGWSDELKAEVEAVLDAGQGQFYFRAEPDPSPKPWATYDTIPASDIYGVAVMIGAPLEDVLRYEQENRNRPAVVDAILKSEAFAAPVVVGA